MIARVNSLNGIALNECIIARGVYSTAYGQIMIDALNEADKTGDGMVYVLVEDAFQPWTRTVLG